LKNEKLFNLHKESKVNQKQSMSEVVNNENEVVVIEKEKEEKEGNIIRPKLESNERQLFNRFEERDEIEFEELNKIAKMVLSRIKDKLQGTDFNNEIVILEDEQVEKLIKQATSNENLCQNYIGWCAFW
jgi:hypothetical protein